MAILKHRKPSPSDEEHGDPAVEEKGGAVDRYASGDEYEILLRFVADEAEKAKHKTDEGEDEDEGKTKRVWYMPWKTVKVKSDKEKKVPEDWLKTDMRQGLSEGDIEGRRKDFGYNELTSPSENQVLKFVSYFRGPILYVMEIAVVLSAGRVGWYQEKQAGDIVAQLKAGIAMKALVIRGGKETEIEARELVIGDIVILEEGSTIPADATILGDYNNKDGSKDEISNGDSTAKPRPKSEKSSDNTKLDHSDAEGDDDEHEKHKGPSILAVDQSAITGESLAVDKYVDEIAYYTCGVKRGKAIGIVSCSAKQSFVGKTATLVMNRLGWHRHGSPCTSQFELSYKVCLVGAAYLARRKCIVQKLTAIESLAGVDVLCSDKTGTLTANKLSLNEPYLVEVAILASSHNVKALDPIDRVTILTLKDYPGAQENLRTGWKTDKFLPFDPVSKRITAEVEKDGKKYTCAKGAPNAILKLKTFDPAVVNSYRDKTQEFAQRGFRSLGVAVKEDGKDWELLGIMSMSDPPRSDTAATIDEAKGLGIRIKILTGDAVAIGKELARQLHLGTNIYDSERLIGGSMSGSEVRDFVEAADEYQVVEFLQQRGHLVAMTGDGVNDAPSLKKANCGIAVEGASDAARSAAAVVFLDEGLNSIITSIKVARQIFHRMKAYIIYRIALCIHLEVYLLLSMLILNETIRVDLVVFLAIFAEQVLVTSFRVVFRLTPLFNSVATIAIAYDKAPFAKKPVEWQLPKVWIVSTIMGLLLAAGTWIIRGTLFLKDGGIIQNFGSVQEVLFLEVALTESWVIFITRMSQTGDEPFVLPSWQLVGAVFGVDILASLFCIFGWISGSGYPEPAFRSGRTSIVAVVRIWLFSFGVTIVVAFAYILLNKVPWLNTLGAQTRSKKNEKLENFLAEMQRMTLKHERDSDGESVYRFSPAAANTDGPKDEAPKDSKKKESTAGNGAKSGEQDSPKEGVTKVSNDTSNEVKEGKTE
ncbi:hypothetical protein RQP46_011475 [Phenoliferia psychrophenolica]